MDKQHGRDRSSRRSRDEHRGYHERERNRDRYYEERNDDRDHDVDRKHRHSRSEKRGFREEDVEDDLSGDERRTRRRSRRGDSSPNPDQEPRRERRLSAERDLPEEGNQPSLSSRKRKEHRDGEVEDERIDDKRARRRFDEDSKDGNGVYGDDKKEMKSKLKSSERREEGENENRKSEKDKEEKRREKRRFSDRDYEKLQGDEEENVDIDKEEKEKRRERRRFNDSGFEDKKEERTQGGNDALEVNGKMSGSTANIITDEPLKASGNSSMASISPRHYLNAKVSSTPTTSETEGVRFRSDEVHGKSSTDGTDTSAGKSGNIPPLDVLAKAKFALQRQKELQEKLKKLNKAGSVSSESLKLTSKEDGVSQKEETKTLVSYPLGTPLSSVQPASSVSVADLSLTATNVEAVKRAQELAAKMGFRQDPEFAPLLNMFPGAASDSVAPQRPTKTPVLRLDAQGREIDEHGNVINISKPTNLTTLKVNINKQKKDAFQIIRPDLDAVGHSTPHFDDRMGLNKAKLLRPRRPGFQFVEEGKLSKLAELQRIKSQFGEAQAKELRVKQAQLAKAKAEPDINPNLIAVAARVAKPKQKEEIPEIEWWDKQILQSASYGDISKENLKMDKITIYIEHPRPIEPPAEPAPPPPQPLKLTKKEQKKLRTQRRIAKEKDRQEMIRQGLLEPPKPKVKMSNLMKVLGSEATQDPTRLEREVRTAAAEREQAHVDRNIARKLTPAERREKRERKLFEDHSTLETVVSVYKIGDLSNPKNRFKVDINAQENRLTGSIVIFDGFTVVVVEGGKKAIKRYGKLMLNRIDWAATASEEDGDEAPEGKPINKCSLVWQGSVAKPSFNKFLVHQCRSEAAGRKVFADAGVPHYWDLAANFTEELE